MHNIRNKDWYVLQAFSGCEKRIIDSIKERIKLNNMEQFFGKIIVPSENVIEMKRGKRKINKKKFFPGYIFIEMQMNKNSWHLIKNTPRIIGFIGGTSEKPAPMNNQEIDNILKKLNHKKNKPRPKMIFEIGEKIRVQHGPFTDFNGTVKNVDYEKNRLKVLVSIFGRSTPVELDFIQVQKKL
ncbi:transcription termination/antitermination protein NusG [Buchnera aphidicola]|uniref:transcription termination/antitermination protein NusG n=1 Tax=Buchnera aphidicola TaxID=9 RepID=UPI0034646066